MVLVYHRLGMSPPAEIVPTVPTDVFRAHVQALGEVADLVSLDEILVRDHRRSASERPGRPMLALTFDDDLPSHVEQALPILRSSGVAATFFLSGRSLHGLGGYWFQQLESLLAAYGIRRVAAMLHLAAATVQELTLACEQDAAARRHVAECAGALPPEPILQARDIRTLAAASMTVGFHTVEHERLTELAPEALARAVSHGRSDVAAAACAEVRYFAFPHGKADVRSAAVVREAGFAAAFTGAAASFARNDDPFRLPRWEPGPVGTDQLLSRLAVRLHRSAPRAPSGS